MTKNIDPKPKKIGDYLKLEKNTTFVIPEYQRAYTWNIEQCDKLWSDIRDYADSLRLNDEKDAYFFGTVIISCEKNDTEFALIDGQQRTTTFLLLLKALLLRINKALLETNPEGDSAGLFRGLKKRRQDIMGILYGVKPEEMPETPTSEDRTICERVNLLVNHSINEQHRNAAGETDLLTILKSLSLEEAKTNVIPIKYKKGDNHFTTFFRNFNYFYDIVNKLSESQVNYITETLLESCEVIEIKSWNVEQAIAMFNSLNADGQPLEDSDIISAQLYAAAKGKGEAQEYSDAWQELKKLLEDLESEGIADVNAILMQQMYYQRAKDGAVVNEKGEANVTTPGLRKYFTVERRNLLQNPLEFCNELKNTAKLWNAVSDFPSVQVLLKLNENAKLFFASFLHRFSDTVTEPDIKPVVDGLTKLFTVLELVDVGYSSKKFKMFLFKESVRLIDPTIPAETILRDIENHIATSWQKDELETKLSAYEDSRLVYLNEYCFAIEHGLKFEIKDRCDIEHIMPQSGTNITAIRKAAGFENDKEGFESIINKLGNKILLEAKINRTIHDKWFSGKISTSIEEKTGYRNSEYPIAQKLVETYQGTDAPTWGVEEIDTATEKATKRIANFIFS